MYVIPDLLVVLDLNSDLGHRYREDSTTGVPCFRLNGAANS